MSDSNSGDKGGSPYGPPPNQNPYGQPANPYGEQPPPQRTPYGEQPPPQNPYGEQSPPPRNPSGEQPQAPYGEQPPPPQNPYGQPVQPPPYGQQPAPYGEPAYGQPGYPYPYGAGPTIDKRPGSVTAASVITLIFSGLSLLLYAFVLIGMVVARDEVVDEITRSPDFEGAGISADSAFGVIVAFVVVFLVWSIIACILAVLVLRRSNGARITLVISSAVTALFSLLGVKAFFPVITLIAAVGVIVLLFVGGANDWFKRRGGQQPAIPGMTQY